MRCKWYNNAFLTYFIYSILSYPCLSTYKVSNSLRSVVNVTLAEDKKQVFLSFQRTYSTNSTVVPTKIYKNAELDKLQILKENIGKAGIYR